MSLHFDGERRLSLPPDQVWPKLRDAGFLVRCIPDATLHGEPTRDLAQCSVKPNITFVRGSMDVTVRILDGQEPSALKFALLSKGIGSSSDVEVVLTLAAADKGSLARWSADVTQLGGLLKMIPPGLIRGAAQKVIEDIWNEIEKRL